MILGGWSAFFASLVAAWLIISTQRVHGRHTEDRLLSDTRKIHLCPTPRVGGIAVFIGLIAGVAVLYVERAASLDLWYGLIIASLPAFFIGLLEDITKRVSSLRRLLVTFIAAALGFFLIDAKITALDIPGIDAALEIGFVSLLFTMFAVGGFAHAMNIIDGANGLAGFAALIIVSGLAVVAWAVGDVQVIVACVIVGAAVAGFLVLNYPRGRIFLGDGGAYLLGFVIAELAVVLVRRNSEISPWFALLGLFYPVWETLFSSYRRRVLQGRSPNDADALHLHTLIYHRVIRWFVGSHSSARAYVRNSLTAPYLWALCALCVLPATVFWRNTLALQVFAVLFAASYLWLYWRIVHFRTPRWMIISNREQPAKIVAENGPRRRRDDLPRIAFERGAIRIPQWRILSNLTKPTRIIAENNLRRRRIDSPQIGVEPGAKARPPN